MTDKNVNKDLTGIQLFSSGEDWSNNACLNYGLDDWLVYAHGYRKAADLLVEHIMVNRRDQDVLVYPIIYLYRQHIELILKKLTRDASDLLNRDFTLTATHRLDALWPKVKELLMEVEVPFGTALGLDAFADADQVIASFMAVDPISMSFRYPEGKKGERLVPEVQQVNVRHLKEIVGKLLIILEGAELSLSMYLDQRSDYYGSL
jgi:hypothetical protein